MGDIISQIWELPWYKVLVIAAADDVILFIKLWPVYIVLLIIFIAIFCMR